jgi:DNA-binding transcriptional LysR family regulator
VRVFPDIVKRVEQVRVHLGLRKSVFTASIGMKPQTYNNFTGVQRSKPNIELLLGIVRKYRANPLWLLTGQGEMFLSAPEWAAYADELLVAGDLECPTATQASALASQASPPEAEETIELTAQLEAQLAKPELECLPVLSRLSQVLVQFLIRCPPDAKNELTFFLRRIVDRAAIDQYQRSFPRTEPQEAARRFEDPADSERNGQVRIAAGAIGRLAGELRVTTTDTLAFGLLNRHLKRFAELYPDIRLHLIIQNRFLSLANRETDVAIRPSVGVHEEEVVGRMLSEIAAAVYASQAYTQAHGRPVSLSELKHHKVITGDESLRHAVTVRWMQGHARAENVVYRSNSLVDHLRALQGGIGVAAMPCFLADPDDRLVRLFPPEPRMANKLWLLTHRDLRRNTCVQAFSDFIDGSIAEERDLLEGRSRQDAA